MNNSRLIRNIFLISFALAIFFPLINIYYIYPSFSRLLIEDTEADAMRTANHLSHMLIPEDAEIDAALITEEMKTALLRSQNDFHYAKIRIFNKSGSLVYSSHSGEIGSVNDNYYFHWTVASKNKITKLVEKDGASAEDDVVTADVVETYVPIMKNGEFKGAFEIDYDITKENKALGYTLFKSSLLVILITFLCIMTVAIYIIRLDMKRSNKSMKAEGALMPRLSPYYSLLFPAVTIFIGEAVVMLLLAKQPNISPMGEVIFDSTLLVILVTPTLYFFLLRPLVLHIKERKIAEDALASEKERLAMTLFSIGDGVITTDTFGSVTEINRVAEKLTGWSRRKALGKDIQEVFELIHCAPGNDCINSIKEVLDGERDGEWFDDACLLLSTDGTERYISANISPIKNHNKELIGSIMVFRDCTKQKEGEDEKARLETQLFHAQKLEAVGTLASGIAHEINTPTQFIGDNTQFLQDSFVDIMELIDRSRTLCKSLADDEEAGRLTEEQMRTVKDIISSAEVADMEYLTEEVPKSISQVLEGVKRVSSIVNAMKNFSHPDKEDMEPSDLNTALENTLTISRSEYKFVADVKLELEDSLPYVPCYLNELNQVFLNLIVNAVHAIEDARGNEQDASLGLITISTRREGAEAVIAISDTGNGIPEDTQPHIFEHFYTTKEVGKGTGQGLSIAHSVITNKHGGAITFETAPGEGTTFFIRLPITTDDEAVNG